MLKTRKGYKRGYPVAILIGLEDDRAVLWKVFSNVVKPEKTVWLDGDKNESKALYNFHESIVNALRPTLREGVKSIILASAVRTSFPQKFIDHVHGHDVWLVQGPNKATFSRATGAASTLAEVAALTRTSMFKRLIDETISEESDNLLGMLEKRLNTLSQNTLILYSLDETEDLILSPQKLGRPKPEYLMLTDKYLSNSHQKNRINRLIQFATNRNVKTRIVHTESAAGQRLMQLGGLACFVQTGRQNPRVNVKTDDSKPEGLL